MTGLVAGIGFRAIGSVALGKVSSGVKAVGGFLRAHSVWLTVSLVLCLGWGVDHVVSHRHAAKIEGQLSTATADLNASRANEVTLRAAITKQNAAVNALAAESARQQKEAAQALSAARQRAAGAQTTSERLKASAVSPERESKPCEPSKALQEQWR